MRLFICSIQLSSTSVDAQPGGRYFQFAANTVRCKHIVNRTAELIGYEIANHAGTVSGRMRGSNRRPARLSPLQRQSPTLSSIRPPAPDHRDLAATIRKCSVLRCVGGQLVKNHGHRLGSFGNYSEGGTLYERAAFSARRELRANKLGQVHTVPAALAQENVCVGQRSNATVEGLKEIFPRRVALARVLCNRGDARQHVLHAMIELRNQKGLVIRGALAFGHIDAHTRESQRPPVSIV